ncbi:hypothetical protein BH11MYX1_BH11MYX1_20230 [soil metagenome]
MSGVACQMSGMACNRLSGFPDSRRRQKQFPVAQMSVLESPDAEAYEVPAAYFAANQLLKLH